MKFFWEKTVKWLYAVVEIVGGGLEKEFIEKRNRKRHTKVTKGEKTH